MPIPAGGWRRRSLLAAGLASLATSACVPRGPATAAALARPIDIAPLPEGSRLELLGGLVLDDEALGFGGLSALHLAEDLQVTAVSDLGHWMTARLDLRDGRPVGLSGLRTGPLGDGAGQPLRNGYSADSESLARMPDGTWLVGFERWHRIRAYRRLDGPGRYVEAPPGLEYAGGNAGLESLAVLADGRWLAIAEVLPVPGRPGLTRAWLGGPGRWVPLAYRPTEGFDPADATPLPDGGALVLERSFSLFGGFGGRLVRIPAEALRKAGPETVLEGEELLRLAAPLPTDNYEGVSAVRVGGRTLVALVSDDNQNLLQKTYLLLFVLADD
ncbi:esterase-like activity of phytase family protein [Paracraurococcus lichenis]|uniref:Esterase-like activity of phytase family protein n=1 Tax=Paracraurococcus lichenis TaxID=3064888 RepID=A0ABT9E6W9_9PROT|nr:esterase-like activity of phytase family protein [Paracraurococcus sp. LOR1-02]MDO9711932.1 esterase-like activity of phytase family protein [Paracraurococcus sp. LOR1-02]